MVKKIKILFVIGTRPELIKFLSLIILIKNKFSNFFRLKICLTGQHTDMLQRHLNEFGFFNTYALDNSDVDGYESSIIKIIQNLKIILNSFSPDYLVVQGDTNSAMIGSMVGHMNKIKVCHIEAGLRSNNIYSPWPEEINRRIISLYASFHFTPTKEASNCLLNEGVSKSNIFLTGNTIVDAYKIIFSMKNFLDQDKIFMNKYDIDLSKEFILITCHRRENIDSSIKNIFDSINLISKKNKINIIFPVHANPSIQKNTKVFLNNKNVFLIPPLEYNLFLYLLYKSKFVISDSGGVQEECTIIGKPILIIRDTTERPEVLIHNGVLVGSNKSKIIKECDKLINDAKYYSKKSIKNTFFGKGNSGDKILNILKKDYDKKD